VRALLPDGVPAALQWRGALRAEPAGDEPTRVLRVDPRDGAAGVFRDSPVVLRLSRPADPESLAPATLRVEGPLGAVPGRVGLSPDGECLIWTGERLFAADSLHFVVLRGLLDDRGREVAHHVSRFVSCDVAWSVFPT
jgi:hypothetical protein